MFQATDAARTQQLDFIESALQKASSLPGWTVMMGHHPAFSGDESYFIEDDTGLPESSAWARVSTTDRCICRFLRARTQNRQGSNQGGALTEPIICIVMGVTACERLIHLPLRVFLMNKKSTFLESQLQYLLWQDRASLVQMLQRAHS